MSRMLIVSVLLVSVASALGASSIPFFDGFEGYASGTMFLVETNGWQANAAGVVVQTGVKHTDTNAVVLPSESSLSNTVDGAGINTIWIDQYVRPNLGSASAEATDNATSVRLYFDETGYIRRSNGLEWDKCDTDVHGGAAPRAAGDWVRVSIRLDCVASNAAILLDGHVLRQQIPFAGANAATLDLVQYRNASDAAEAPTNGYVDDVVVTTDLPAGLESGVDGDTDGMADAMEIHLYGHTDGGSPFAQGLPFSDGFESYSAGDQLSDLGLAGWSASDTNVIVQTAEKNDGAQAVIMPMGESASNSFVKSGSKLWMDCYVNPSRGTRPGTGSDESLHLYFDSNGYVAVSSNSAWDVCTLDAFGQVVAPVTGEWARVTLHLDYGTAKAAVLLRGRVLREQIPFVGTPTGNIAGLVLRNAGGEDPAQENSYVDDVWAGVTVPSGLSQDGDGDGIPDAQEIHEHGTVSHTPAGGWLMVR